MVTRAISTVVDVTVCLLLLSAAVGTLLMTDPPAVDGTADDTIEQLAATTATVNGSAEPAPRRISGTHAELLARAAVANLTFADRRLAPTTGSFRAAVRDRVGRVLDRAPSRTAVTARYLPYPDAPIEGRLTVGAPPPDRASVSTARLSVPLPMDGDRVDSAGSFDPLALGLSETVVDHTVSTPVFPNARHDERARAWDRALGDPPADARGRALAARLARDMREQFSSPGAAAEAIRPAVVRVVVREWEP